MRFFEESNFFVIHSNCIEKNMEQFISGELKKIFRVNSHNLFIGLTVGGKHAWQQEKEIKEDSSNVLMLQEQLFISELFRDIQDAILLIFHYKTMLLFRANSSNMFTILDVRSIYIYHQFWINTWRSKVRARDRQYSSCLFGLWTKVTKFLIHLSVPRHAQYLHTAWKRHQDAVSWVDINLAPGKD